MGKTPRHSRLRAHLGYWLRRLSDEIHTAFERALARHDVTVAQWTVLSAVTTGLTTPAEVASYIAIDPGAVTRLVDRLAAKGLLVRETDPQDRRVVRLALTEEGRALTPELAAIADRNDAAFLGVLTSAERRQLAALLAKVLRAWAIDTAGWSAMDEPDPKEDTMHPPPA